MTAAKKKMTPERIVRWVHALESGDYKQGRSNMYKRSEDVYCCLGVLSKINGKKEDEIENRAYPYEFEFCGCGDHSPLTAFATLNDKHKLTFDQIAQVIRDACPELFEDEEEY